MKIYKEIAPYTLDYQDKNSITRYDKDLLELINIKRNYIRKLNIISVLDFSKTVFRFKNIYGTFYQITANRIVNLKKLYIESGKWHSFSLIKLYDKYFITHLNKL